MCMLLGSSPAGWLLHRQAVLLGTSRLLAGAGSKGPSRPVRPWRTPCAISLGGYLRRGRLQQEKGDHYLRPRCRHANRQRASAEPSCCRLSGKGAAVPG
jgi:hypothetical protein